MTSSVHRNVLRFSVVSLFFCCAVACDRKPQSPSSPRETALKLRELRAGRAYTEMESLIVAGRSGPVIELLGAIDEFLASNKELCEVVQDQIGEGPASAIDCSYLVANLEIFSPHVEILDERIAGNAATVGLVVDGKLPAVLANFRKHGSAWLYDPGDGYSADWPQAFRSMAHGLRQVTDDLRTGRLSVSDLRNDPERIGKEVVIRLNPGVRLLTRAGSAGHGP